MTVRNVLITLAKRKNFDKELFIEKMESIKGLSEKQWKANCLALIEQITRTIKGKNISIGRHIAQYEKILNEKKSLLNKEQEAFYKKEITRLKKEKQKENFFDSEREAVQMLIGEGYFVFKEGRGIDNNQMLNVLKDRYNKMTGDEKDKFMQQLKKNFLSE